MKQEIERRFRTIDSKELRVTVEDEKMILEGYPIVYNQRTVLWPGMVEIIKPGAAKRALEKRTTKVYWNHDTSKPMAGFSNGTLEATEDEHGVFMRAEVQGTVWGREGYEAIKSGIVNQMSFAFKVDRGQDEWTSEENEDGSVVDVRTIKEFELIPDFSPVCQPAYPTTEVYARSKELILRNRPEPEASGEGAPAGGERSTPLTVLREKLDLLQKEYENE